VRINRDGTRNKQDLSTQDFPRLNLSPEGRAMRKFLGWAEEWPEDGSYELLPPSAQMAIQAVRRVAGQLAVLKESKE
jgi:hypothetical protein